MYEDALKGQDGEEVKRRVGQRVRELEAGIEGLDRLASEGD